MDTKATVVASGMVTDQKAGRKRVQMRLAGPDIDPFVLVVDGDTPPPVGSEVTLTVAVKGGLPKREGKPSPLGVRNDTTETRPGDEAELLRIERAAAEHRAEGGLEGTPQPVGPVGTVGATTSKTVSK